LNSEMAFILRYFAKFGSFESALRKSGWQSYGRFTIIMSSSKRLQRAYGINYLQITDS